MRGRTTSATDEQSDLAEFVGGLPSRPRRLSVIVVVVLALIVATAVAVVSGVFADGGDIGSRPGDKGSATSLAIVQRRTLSTQTQFNGTLGYAASYTVCAQAHGTVTWLPRPGQVIRDGQVLYRVDDAPVVLLHGSVPAYRALAEGATGPDVAQLNHDLVTLGYVATSQVDSAWDHFSWATRTGVEQLQRQHGVTQTGELSLGDVMFLPTAARVTTLRATLGGPAAGPIMTASSTARTVSVALDPSLQSQVRAGDRVTITLPDGSTTDGTVTAVGKVATVSSNNFDGAGSGGSANGPTVPVHIRPTHLNAADSLDQALVEVAITDQTVHNVLAVPVTALLARSGGAYSVEVVAGDGTRHLVRVTPGLFDDVAGMVQVSGPEVRAGQRVVVPGE